jgi:hypothetical protein
MRAGRAPAPAPFRHEPGETAMTTGNKRSAETEPSKGARLPGVNDVFAWMNDAAQRNLLFLEVMRRRSEAWREHEAMAAPHVLSYEAELVVDGRTLARPVNYVLARIVPPAGVEIDPTKRPFVVIDPRAGHGPGIGGFKADSEIGVAMKAGHPCYFVGFLPDPVPGQTILDVTAAEATFLETVIARHPDANGKPCVVGNCQAGWAVAMLAALRPELMGPMILAGTPLSYWAGVRGKYPMRYSGGLLGGSWMTSLLSDLGGGVFDGAWLVQNFENQNPANTLWTKQYNLWANIDTEADRYLGFEKWWGGHVNLNAEEIQFIVDELFVGNRLAAGDIRTADGTQIDLRNIRSPIVVFCSKGDNITPPQQALDWILDLYDSVDDIRRHGQTIVYTVHESVGHLGIFVSGGVAKKEHGEFASNIDLIETLPPGLYEAIMTPKGEAADNPDLVSGEWVMRCEARSLDDIRAMGGNDMADERRFAAAARVSEINLALYRTFAQPWIRATATPPVAEAFRRLHPLRLQYDLFGDSNPFMRWVSALAENARADRRPAGTDNPMTAMQEAVSERIVEGLDAWRIMVERWSEETFRTIYGSPALQSALGIDPNSAIPPRRAAHNPLHDALVEEHVRELRAKIGDGGPREAAIRALIWVGIARRTVDERGFAAVRRLRKSQAEATAGFTLANFKAALREQFFMVLIDPDAALSTLPRLAGTDPETRRKIVDLVAEVLSASGPIEGEVADRLDLVAETLGVENPASGAGSAIPMPRAASGRSRP